MLKILQIFLNKQLFITNFQITSGFRIFRKRKMTQDKTLTEGYFVATLALNNNQNIQKRPSVVGWNR